MDVWPIFGFRRTAAGAQDLRLLPCRRVAMTLRRREMAGDTEARDSDDVRWPDAVGHSSPVVEEHLGHEYST